MRSGFTSKKIAVLLSSGFNEGDLTSLQKALMPYKPDIRIVSTTRGLVNSWTGENWGLSFAADKALNETLSSDFSMLVIPGGQRSMEKLKLTAHTKRFIGGFLDTGKPVVAMGEALDLLAFIDKVDGRTVSGPDIMKDVMLQAGATWSDDNPAVDDNLMTGVRDGDAFVESVIAFLGDTPAMDQAA